MPVKFAELFVNREDLEKVSDSLLRLTTNLPTTDREWPKLRSDMMKALSKKIASGMISAVAQDKATQMNQILKSGTDEQIQEFFCGNIDLNKVVNAAIQNFRQSITK